LSQVHCKNGCAVSKQAARPGSYSGDIQPCDDGSMHIGAAG